MNSEQESAILRQLIADNQNKAAAERLSQWFADKSESRQDAALALLSRIQSLDSSVLGGLISQADADLERNRITKALLELSKQLDDTGEIAGAPAPPGSKAWIFGVLAIVVAGMLYLALDKSGSKSAAPDTFSLNVHVHGPGGEPDLITSGKIKLLLGAYHSPVQDINSSGQAIFDEIPGKYLAEPVQAVPLEMRYKVTGQSARTAQESRNITFTLAPIPDTTVVRGVVYLPGAGNKPAAGAELDFNGGQATAVTDEKGRFQMAVPMATGKTAKLMIDYQHKNRYNRDLTVSASTLFQLTLNP
jgi:DNA-binding transcriptional regulator YbjK